MTCSSTVVAWYRMTRSNMLPVVVVEDGEPPDCPKSNGEGGYMSMVMKVGDQGGGRVGSSHLPKKPFVPIGKMGRHLQC